MKDNATNARGYCWMDLEIESRWGGGLWHTEIQQRRNPRAPENVKANGTLSHEAACAYALVYDKQTQGALLEAVERDIAAGFDLTDYAKMWMYTAQDSRHTD